MNNQKNSDTLRQARKFNRHNQTQTKNFTWFNFCSASYLKKRKSGGKKYDLNNSDIWNVFQNTQVPRHIHSGRVGREGTFLLYSCTFNFVLKYHSSCFSSMSCRNSYARFLSSPLSPVSLWHFPAWPFSLSFYSLSLVSIGHMCLQVISPGKLALCNNSWQITPCHTEGGQLWLRLLFS